jgi:glycosyltransferase involved in cell wall biosynthesis
MTTISIVVPAHNCRPWIAELLESIKAQTYPRDRLETIVIADGSGDASAAIARSFLVRHAMQGTVLVGERGASAGAAMNLGWRAAAGEWIQFVRGRDVLAPNKIEVQAKAIPQLADDVSAIFSSWQLLGLADDQWLLAGPVHRPQLADSIVLKLLERPVARLGAGLIRKKAIVAVAGFSEDVAFALEQHFLLKIAGIGVGQAGSAAFVEASWPRPLFFERQAAERPSRHGRVGSARQHLENVLFARAILQQHGLLTQANGDALAALCNEGLRDLYACDTATFRSCARRLREIDRRLVPTPVAPRKYVEVLGSLGGRLTSRTGPLYRAIWRGAHLMKHRLLWVRGRSAEILHDIESVGRGIAKSLARGAGRLVLPRSSKRVPAAASMIAVVLLGGILTLAALGKYGDFAGPSGSPERSQQRGVAPTIVVASTIYAEPASRWPMPIEVGPAQSVPPGSNLLIRGLPPAATLSEGRRMSAGAWAVAVTRLASLEVQVPAGSQGRSDLTLALVGNDDGSLAEAHTELSINEPTVMIPSAPAAVARPLTPPLVAPPPSTIAAAPAARARPVTPSGAPTRPPPVGPPAATGSVPTAPALGTVVTPPTAVAAPTVASTVADARSAPPQSSVPAAKVALHASAVAESASGDPPQSAPRAATTAESGNTAATLVHSGTDDPPSSSSPAEVVLSPPPTATRGAMLLAPSYAAAIAPDPDRSPGARGLAAAEDGRRSAAKMIARGERDLADGNIAVARQFLLRAAEAGLAHGALLLASTYDAYELARMGVRGVQANPSVARMWYERARELGASEAEALLLRLGGFD